MNTYVFRRPSAARTPEEAQATWARSSKAEGEMPDGIRWSRRRRAVRR